jgi:EmrB/QacA subfamily drug resistance transporter
MESKVRNQILLVLFIGVLMGALDIAIVGPALPMIRNTFGVDDRAIAWVFTTYVLFNLIGVPLMAKLSDAFGRRAIYILDVALFAIGSLSVALSPQLNVLLVGRALQGFGAGGIFPVASAVIGDTFPPEKRGGALGLIGAVFGIAFLVGPLLAGVMLRFLSWPWLFLINLPIAVLLIGLALRLLPSARLTQSFRFDWLGMATLSVALASLTLAVNQLDTTRLAASLVSSNVLPFVILVLGLFPLFLWIEGRAANPLVQPALLRLPQVLVVGLVAIGAGVSEAAVVFVPTLAVEAFGVSSSSASFMLLPAVLAMAIGSPVAGRMLDRIGSRVVLFISAVLTTAGLGVVALLGTQLVFFYVAALLAGLGLSGLLGAPLRYVMLNEAPVSERAAAQGLLTLHTSIGQLVGGAMVGAVAASFGGGVRGYAQAFLTVGLVMAVLSVLTLRLKGRAEELTTARANQAATGR